MMIELEIHGSLAGLSAKLERLSKNAVEAVKEADQLGEGNETFGMGLPTFIPKALTSTAITTSIPLHRNIPHPFRVPLPTYGWRTPITATQKGHTERNDVAQAVGRKVGEVMRR